MVFCRIFLRSLMLVTLLALLSGCVTTTSRPSDAQRMDTEQARALQHQGRFNDAAKAWQRLAADYRGWRDRYLLNAAEAYRQIGDWTAAQPILDDINRSHLDGDQLHHLDLLEAEAALASGTPETTLQLTSHAANLPQQWILRGKDLRARALAATDRPLEAARIRLTMNDALAGFDRSQNEQKLLTLLKSMDNATLQSAASQLAARDPMRAWIADALKANGSALADELPQLQHRVGTFLPGSGNAVSSEGFHPPESVALLLPISGPLQMAGAAVQDGFTVAWQGNPRLASYMDLQVLDSGGTVGGALSAYRQAVSAGVDLVVGPLSSKAVDALFREKSLPVPVLALNHPQDGLPPAGSFEFSLPPEAEGAQIAARMTSRGLTEALLFLADADWAQRAARSFRAQFESRGGHVVGSATLTQTQVNYSDTIEAMLANASPNTAIFIAMRPRQGRLLVPQLRIAQVTQPLFATSHIYGGDTDIGSNRDLDGVIFCDAPWLFDAEPSLIQRSQLEDNPNTHGPAARLFAFGMDAFALMPYLDWMRAHPGSYLTGATGQLTMDDFGRIIRVPIWAQFVNGVATPITGALHADTPNN